MKSFDTRVWVVWLAAGGLLTLLARNPLYMLILLATARTVGAVVAPEGSEAIGVRLPFWRLAAVILLFSTLFNALTAHFGATTLFSLPPHWWLVGGPITLEAAVFGLISGLSLVTLLAFFLTFNSVVSAGQLARLTPRALADIGLVVLVAVTYLPETMRQWQRIRDAQALRGHRLRSLRDLRPVTLPLLIGGMERAMNLAEAMVGRGYGSTSTVGQSPRLSLLSFLGLLLSFAGWIALAWWGRIGWALLATGIGLLVAAYRLLGRRVRYTRYRPRRWQPADTVIVIASLTPLLLFAVFGGKLETAYSPYPALTVPAFNVWFGTALLCLAAPAILFLL